MSPPFSRKGPLSPATLARDTRILGDVISELPLPISGYRFFRLISVWRGSSMTHPK